MPVERKLVLGLRIPWWCCHHRWTSRETLEPGTWRCWLSRNVTATHCNKQLGYCRYFAKRIFWRKECLVIIWFTQKNLDRPCASEEKFYHKISSFLCSFVPYLVSVEPSLAVKKLCNYFNVTSFIGYSDHTITVCCDEVILSARNLASWAEGRLMTIWPGCRDGVEGCLIIRSCCILA